MTTTFGNLNEKIEANPLRITSRVGAINWMKYEIRIPEIENFLEIFCSLFPKKVKCVLKKMKNCLQQR